MRRVIFLFLITFLFFFAEFIVFNVAGRLFKPDLLILPVIYFNLTWGIRYSLVCALFAGILKDSFGTHVFGMHLFAFIASAYLTTVIKGYLFHMGSRTLRIFIVCLVTILNQLILYALNPFYNDTDVLSLLSYVLLPQVFMTTLLTNWIFHHLKKCVLRLSV